MSTKKTLGSLPVYVTEINGNYNLLTPLVVPRIRARENMGVNTSYSGRYVMFSPLSDGKKGFTTLQIDTAASSVSGKVDSRTEQLTLKTAGTFFSSVLKKGVRLAISLAYSSPVAVPAVVIDKVYIGKVYLHRGNIVDYAGDDSQLVEEAVIIAFKRQERGV